MTADLMYDALLALPLDPQTRALAARYAPIIRFDAREPFLPLAAGITLFTADGPSPSFTRTVSLAAPAPGAQPAALAIEYAIWWDWDIGHLYELEHVWVYIDAAGNLLRCEASAHGGFAPMLVGADVEREGDHPVLYAEPGKHAFAAEASRYTAATLGSDRTSTNELAGMGGLLVTSLFTGAFRTTPQIDTLARSYLMARAFTPSYEFSRRFAFTSAQLVAWPALRDWIPRRITWWVERLRSEIPPAAYEPLRIGHRGAAAHAPDNSLAGIDAAARLGAHMVEIDVQLTRDGAPVAVHDQIVRDGAGRALPVGALTAADLAATPSAPPTLADIVARCRERRLGIYLELKDGAAIAPTVEVLRAQGAVGRTIGASFRPDWLADLRAAAPEMATAVLFSAPTIDAVALARACGATYVHPCWERRAHRPDELLTDAWVAKVRAAELGIICWHEERPEVIAGLRRRGVDGICSDRPELLKGNT
jgi:glycerophosphoryl diester phosphodiesterase